VALSARAATGHASRPWFAVFKKATTAARSGGGKRLLRVILIIDMRCTDAVARLEADVTLMNLDLPFRRCV